MPPLLVDFATQFQKVQGFYHPLPISPDQIAARATQVASNHRLSRGKLLPALKAYNESLGCSPKVLENLSRLESSDCVAAVTGQQVTLFGGPSYTIYKTATAIRLAAQMRDEGIEAVPIFWLASNDSDFEEIRSTDFLNSERNLLHLRFPEAPESAARMAGTVSLKGIGACLKELAAATESMPFAAPVMERLTRAYAQGRTFREAFAMWLSETFSDYGLIVFDPLMDGYQEHLSDFYECTISNRSSLNADLLARNAALEEAGYSPQVWVDETESLLFLVDGQERYKLQHVNGSYQTKEGKRASFSESDLLEVARKEPQRLSANVLLRPILQDYLLPTAYYIGGPSEVAYFAQLNAISGYWGLETVIAPRAGFTIVDRRQQRYLERHHLTPLDLLQKSRDSIAETVLSESKTGAVLDQLDGVKATLGSQLDLLKQEIRQSDASVAAMLENAQGKMFYQLDKVRTRFVKNYQASAPALQRHLDHLLTHLRPSDKPQERVLNFNHFLMQHGPDFLDTITQRVQPFCLSHQLLQL